MEALLAACCIGALHPSLLWRDDYFDEAEDVVADGNTAYVAAGASGVLVVDVTNPASPTLLGVCGVHGATVRISGTRLYATSDNNWVTVCDVSDPSAPTVVGGFRSPSGGFLKMEVSGTKVFLLDSYESKLYVMEAADPEAPTVLAEIIRWQGIDGLGVMEEHQVVVLSVRNRLQFYNVTGSLVGELNMTSSSWVRVSGGVAYVGCGSQGRDLCTIDVTDPASPSLIGSVKVGYMREFAVSGTMGYTSGSGSNVYCIDVSDAASPSAVATFTAKAQLKGIAAAGTTVLLVSSESPLLLVDSSVPANPQQVGQLPPSRTEREALSLLSVPTARSTSMNYCVGGLVCFIYWEAE